MLELIKSNYGIAKEFFNLVLDIDDTLDSTLKPRSHLSSITYRESVPIKRPKPKQSISNTHHEYASALSNSLLLHPTEFYWQYNPDSTLTKPSTILPPISQPLFERSSTEGGSKNFWFIVMSED